jgi:xylulokinase
VVALGVPVERVLLVGGAASSPAVQQLAPGILGRPVLVPPPGEYVADGAARQAAWVLSGDDAPPEWAQPGLQEFDAPRTPPSASATPTSVA